MVNYLSLYDKAIQKQDKVYVPLDFSVSCGLSRNSMKAVFPWDYDILPLNNFLFVAGTEFGGKITSREIDFRNKTVTYYGTSLYGVLDNLLGEYPPNSLTIYIYKNNQHADSYSRSIDGWLENRFNTRYEWNINYTVADIDDSYFVLVDSEGYYLKFTIAANESLLSNIKTILANTGMSFSANIFPPQESAEFLFLKSKEFVRDVEEIKADVIFSEDIKATAMTYYKSGNPDMAYIDINGGVSIGGLFNHTAIENQKYKKFAMIHKIETGKPSDAEAKEMFSKYLENSGFSSQLSNFTPQDDFMRLGDRLVLKSRKFGIKTNPQTLTEKVYQIRDGVPSLQYNFSGGT